LPGVVVKLTISVDEYDPETPSKGIVKCVVVNGGDKPVEVTLGYDGRANLLRAGAAVRGLTLYPAGRPKPGQKAERAEPKTAKVEPQAEQTVFELNLDEILTSRSARGERAWRWDWTARPAPPPSPIHRVNRLGFVRLADFLAEVSIASTPHVSNRVTLKIKPPLNEPR
jgi:hypothetical protein